MADAVAVFPPGFRVTDADDNPVNNAKITFREVGPGALKTVYSDADLSVSLGSTVRTRSDGQPVVSEGSSTTTLIYVGSDPYYILITDADDVVIIPAKDNVKGAFTAAESEAVIPPVPVITTGSPLTLEAEHKGKLINATGNTLTFTSAVTLGDGWWVKVRNNHASSLVTLVAASGISFEGGSFTQRALLPGEAMEIVCDGTAFRVSSHTPPLLAPQGPGLVTIVDRVSAEPGAPTAGTRYLVSASFGAFTTHQIIEYTGAGWNAYTPPTDCGWLAYVQDENVYYRFVGSAWALEFATDAEILTGTSTEKGITPAGLAARAPRKLASGTVADASTLDIVLTAFAAYKFLELRLSNFLPATDNVTLNLQFSTDGGGNFDASGYNYAFGEYTDAGTSADRGSDSDTEIQLNVVGVGNAANEGISGVIELFGPADTTFWNKVLFRAFWIDNAGTPRGVTSVGGGSREAAQNTDAIRLLFSSGNIASGDWALYGYP